MTRKIDMMVAQSELFTGLDLPIRASFCTGIPYTGSEFNHEIGFTGIIQARLPGRTWRLPASSRMSMMQLAFDASLPEP